MCPPWRPFGALVGLVETLDYPAPDLKVDCRTVPGRPGRRTAEERTKAVLELLSGKASIGALARRFGVRERTIEKWREQALESVEQSMRQGDPRSGRERELEKELKALRHAFTDLAIRHELRERAVKDRPTRSGRSSR